MLLLAHWQRFDAGTCWWDARQLGVGAGYVGYMHCWMIALCLYSSLLLLTTAAACVLAAGDAGEGGGRWLLRLNTYQSLHMYLCWSHSDLQQAGWAWWQVGVCEAVRGRGAGSSRGRELDVLRVGEATNRACSQHSRVQHDLE